MRTNAKEEFVNHIADRTVKCATIYDEDSCWVDAKVKIGLPVGHSPEQFEAFLKSLDFAYDSGYGGQELFGTIWFDDGTWSERGEYDGSEWWEHREVPEIPEQLKGINDAK